MKETRKNSAPKRFVDFLGKHTWFQKLFFPLGFYNLRLVFPLQYLILKELIDCKSVLDLGCGGHSMVPIIPSWIHTVGVEIFEPYYQEAIKKQRHKKYIKADVLDVDFEDGSFDAVVLLDVLEHLPKERGNELLLKMQRWAKKKVIVFTPNGFLHQDHYDNNPYMEHKSGWEMEEFSSRGFKVYGVRGLKQMKKKSFEEKPTKWKALNGLLDLTQIYTYFYPKSAFQLFCVKYL